MSLTLNDLLAASKTLEVKLTDEITIKVKYKISYMTPAFEAKYRGLSDGTATQAELLEEMIDVWNLGPDGEYIAPKKGQLEKLGVIVQNAIWKTVWEDCFPNAQ